MLLRTQTGARERTVGAFSQPRWPRKASQKTVHFSRARRMGGIKKAERYSASEPQSARTQAAAPASCPQTEAALPLSHPRSVLSYSHPSGEGSKIPFFFNHRLAPKALNRSHFLDGVATLQPWGNYRHLIPHASPAWAAGAKSMPTRRGQMQLWVPSTQPPFFYTAWGLKKYL